MAAEVYVKNVERLRRWASRRLSACTIGKETKKVEEGEGEYLYLKAERR
jgi:hypothetical protein